MPRIELRHIPLPDNPVRELKSAARAAGLVVSIDNAARRRGQQYLFLYDFASRIEVRAFYRLSDAQTWLDKRTQEARHARG